VAVLPRVARFDPVGCARREKVTLTVDEVESLRLADAEGLSQQEAAAAMAVSRPTFGRIVESARRKVARALVRGAAIVVEGGNYSLLGIPCTCDSCGQVFGRRGRTRQRCPCCESAE